MPGSGDMPSTTRTSAPAPARLQSSTTRSMSVWSSFAASSSSAAARVMGGGGARFAPSFMSAPERESTREATGFTKATRTPSRSRARTRPRHAVVRPTWRPAGATRRVWGMGVDLGGRSGGRDGAAAGHDLGGVQRDHELLVGRDDRGHRARGPGDAAALRPAVGLVHVRVEGEAGEPEELDDAGAD